MDKDQKSVVQSFLEGTEDNKFEQVIDSPFIETEQKEELEEKEEKPLPFHKDPKVQKFIDKELERRLKDFKPEPQKVETKSEDDDYYVRLIGNDTPEKVAMVKEAKARDERMLEQAEERAFNRLSQREQEEVQAEKEAEQELDSAFESIEETYDVDLTSARSQKTRSEFLTFVEKIAPKNKDGEILDYPDMNSAWETFSEMRKPSEPSRAKQLASRGMARSSESTASVQGKSPTFDMDIEEMIAGTK